MEDVTTPDTVIPAEAPAQLVDADIARCAACSGPTHDDGSACQKAASLQAAIEGAKEVLEFIRGSDDPKPATPVDELADLSATVRSLMAQIMTPGFAGHIEVAGAGETFRLQFGFIALEAVAARFGSYEEMGALILKASERGTNETFMAVLDAAAIVLKGATLRHHQAMTEDELDDLFSLLGDASSIVYLSNAVLNWWKDHDTLGPYVAGIDPVIALGERSYKLRFALRAVRHVQQLMKTEDFGTLQARHYREVLRAQLLRFHAAEFAPGVEAANVVLDDLGWQIGLGGLRRLMAGAEQPRRHVDDVVGDTDPNALAGLSGPAKSGTGQPS